MMLRRPCKILGPFTFSTIKKTSVLRYNLVLRFPFGCFHYHRKSIYQHIGRNKGCSNKEWEVTKKSVLKEQKNFIWTSFLFLKDKDKGKTANALDIKKNESQVKDKPIGSVLNSEISEKNLIKDFKKNTQDEQDSTKAKKSDQIIGFVKKSDSVEKDEKFTKKATPGIDSKVLVEPGVQKKLDSSISLKPNEFDPDDDRRLVHKKILGRADKLDDVPCKIERAPTAVDSGDPIKDDKQALLKEFYGAESTQNNNGRIPKTVYLGAPKGDTVNTQVRRRQTVDLNRSSTERNFITPVRAMTDFLLKPSDLEGLRKTKRRSPYENDPPITVYWRKDVEAKALDVWGSKENLLKEMLKKDIERRRYQQNLFTVKRRLRDYRREQGRESEIKLEQNGLMGSSGKVVLTAIGINGTNFLFKLLAWVYTGSHSMFSEAVHSLADTINQLILAFGIHKSVQRADSHHPYGYTNMRYVSSLISGVGIFCVGSGLSFYHGFVGLSDPSSLPSFYWAYFVLCGSLVSEGATLLVAFNSIRVGARNSQMSLSEYVLRGQDPSVNVVLLEDMAAVIGVSVAASCMGLSSYYDSHIPDAVGSFLVGGLLGCVASFIIYTNVAALVGRSIPQERLDKINSELESDVMIRAIHDVKGIDIGNSLVRYKAEMDFDGGELTRSYLDKQDLNQMLEEVRKMQTIDELEEFMLKHGENIVDMMGGEIDRIELKLRKKHPEIRHCDLEIL